MRKLLIWFLVIATVTLLAFIRLAPSDPARWHKQAKPFGIEEIRSDQSYVWRELVEGNGTEKLRALDAVAMKTPRTKRMAGSLEDGQITYITRSKVFGFPDYTTIGVYDGLIENPDQYYLEINARLRFGSLDLGVNAKRVKGWLAAVE